MVSFVDYFCYYDVKIEKTFNRRGMSLAPPPNLFVIDEGNKPVVL